MIGLFEKDERLELPEDDQPWACYGCGHSTAPLRCFDARRANSIPPNNRKWLCYLCYSSESGTTVEYPENYSGDLKAILKHTTYLANEILLAISEIKESSQ